MKGREKQRDHLKLAGLILHYPLSHYYWAQHTSQLHDSCVPYMRYAFFCSFIASGCCSAHSSVSLTDESSAMCDVHIKTQSKYGLFHIHMPFGMVCVSIYVSWESDRIRCKKYWKKNRTESESERVLRQWVQNHYRTHTRIHQRYLLLLWVLLLLYLCYYYYYVLFIWTGTIFSSYAAGNFFLFCLSLSFS